MGSPIGRLAGSFLAVISFAAPSPSATGASAPNRPEGPHVVVADVERFFRIYDAAGGHPAADDLQRLYIDSGSAGMRDFVRLRGLTGASLSAAIEKDPAPFEGARVCVATLPGVRLRLLRTLDKLRSLHRPAEFPPITVLVGRGRTGATTSKAGVLIGLETLCAASFLDDNREDRLVHLIAHEYAHVQQPSADATDLPGATVLFASLIEGGAELVAELTSGKVSYSHLHRWTSGRERAVMSRFLADRESTDLTAWLYNGIGTPDRPGDLGYWAGYVVAKSYYARAADKRRALANIIGVTPGTAASILRGSGLLSGPRARPTARQAATGPT